MLRTINLLGRIPLRIQLIVHSDNTKVDLIIRPTADGYQVYYYGANGEKVFSDKDGTPFSEKVASAKNSENANYRADYDSLSPDAQFQADFGTSAKPVKTFNTGSDGVFWVNDASDGDQVYFKDDVLNSYDRFWVTEDTDLLKHLSEDKLTGEYKTDDAKLTITGNHQDYNAGDSNSFLVHNSFDRPTDAFVIRKSVDYYGSYTNPDADKLFYFDVLINNAAPNGLSWQITQDGDAISKGTFSAAATSTTPYRFSIKAGQQFEIIGMKKNTPVEVHELIMENRTLLKSLLQRGHRQHAYLCDREKRRLAPV